MIVLQQLPDGVERKWDCMHYATHTWIIAASSQPCHAAVAAVQSKRAHNHNELARCFSNGAKDLTKKDYNHVTKIHSVTMDADTTWYLTTTFVLSLHLKRPPDKNGEWNSQSARRLNSFMKIKEIVYKGSEEDMTIDDDDELRLAFGKATSNVDGTRCKRSELVFSTLDVEFIN